MMGGLKTDEFLLDSGLFHIYNNDTFDDAYINQPSIDILTVKSYKPS